MHGKATHHPRSSVSTTLFLPPSRGAASCIRTKKPSEITMHPASRSFTCSRDALANGKRSPTTTTPGERKGE